MRVGLDVGGTKTDAVVVDDDGGIAARIRLATGWGGDEIIRTVVAAVHSVAADAGTDLRSITSVGIGIPGQVDAVPAACPTPSTSASRSSISRRRWRPGSVSPCASRTTSRPPRSERTHCAAALAVSTFVGIHGVSQPRHRCGCRHRRGRRALAGRARHSGRGRAHLDRSRRSTLPLRTARLRRSPRRGRSGRRALGATRSAAGARCLQRRRRGRRHRSRTARGHRAGDPVDGSTGPTVSDPGVWAATGRAGARSAMRRGTVQFRASLIGGQPAGSRTIGTELENSSNKLCEDDRNSPSKTLADARGGGFGGVHRRIGLGAGRLVLSHPRAGPAPATPASHDAQCCRVFRAVRSGPAHGRSRKPTLAGRRVRGNGRRRESPHHPRIRLRRECRHRRAPGAVLYHRQAVEPRAHVAGGRDLLRPEFHGADDGAQDPVEAVRASCWA